MNTVSTSILTSGMSEFYSKTILSRAMPELVHDRFGQSRPIPKNSSKTIRWSRYGLFASSASSPTGVLADVETSTSPLSEGIAPSGKYVKRANVECSLQQYGDYVEYTDMVSLTNPDPVLTEINELLGESAGRSLDIIHRDQLVAGTNVFYSGSATSKATVDTVIATAILDKIIRALRNQVARPFGEIIRPTTGVGTTPVRAAYWAIVHPDVWFTLEGLAGVITLEKYPSQSGIAKGEVGAYKELRFILSTQAKVETGAGASSSSVKNTGSVADVYTTLVFGRDAYGISALAGNAMRSITKPLGSAGTADPLDQKGTVGWKAITCPAKILNDNWMAVLLTAAAL